MKVVTLKTDKEWDKIYEETKTLQSGQPQCCNCGSEFSFADYRNSGRIAVAVCPKCRAVLRKQVRPRVEEILMTAIKIFWAFVLANLSFGNTGLEPDWSQILGSISCHNAVREHHYVPNAGCAVTTCEFPQGEYYIFVACNDYEEAACVSLDLKDAKCAEPREVF